LSAECTRPSDLIPILLADTKNVENAKQKLKDKPGADAGHKKVDALKKDKKKR